MSAVYVVYLGPNHRYKLKYIWLNICGHDNQNSLGMVEPLTKLIRVINTHLDGIHAHFYGNLVTELEGSGFRLIETSKDRVIETWEHDGINENGDSTWITIDGNGVVHEIKNTSALLPNDFFE